MGQFKLNNNQSETFTLSHEDNVGQINVTTDQFVLNKNGVVILKYLPTIDPQIVGQLWVDADVLKVSQG